MSVYGQNLPAFDLDHRRKDVYMKPVPVKETIPFDDFEKIDIRVGTITSVSDIEKSNKLMKLSVDFGDHVRSILAGIKKRT